MYSELGRQRDTEHGKERKDQPSGASVCSGIVVLASQRIISGFIDWITDRLSLSHINTILLFLNGSKGSVYFLKTVTKSAKGRGLL